jgi:Tol biopolymer transport system component
VGGRRADRRTLLLSTVAGLALLLLPAAGAAPGATTRLSVASAGTQANGHNLLSAISADGRFVAFYSEASTLVEGDTNDARDVFVRDRQSGVTTRVSIDSAGAQGNSHSFAPAISSDGRLVAFYSHASNLVVGDTNGRDDVFVHDRQTRATTRVSVAPGGAEGNGGSYSPALNADGRFVAFLSDASNLVAGDTNTVRDVFVHDRQAGTTTRVSLSSDGVQGNINSISAALNADARFVVFSSYALNLIPDDTNDGADVFVHDRQDGTTKRVSVYEGNVEADGDSLRPVISADGRFVAFDSDAYNLAWGDTNEVFDVFVHDRQIGVTTRVSVDDGGGQANALSLRPALSADARFVAFYSEATDLVVGDTNAVSDVIVHDRESGATTRVSVDDRFAQGNGDSLRPALSANGRVVAFESDATNLVAGDSNRFSDVFARDLTAVPPPPPAPPPARCRVPRVIGLRLATAKARIRRANCRVGRVRRARSRRVGRVLRQSPRAGVRRARGARVNLVVGRR